MKLVRGFSFICVMFFTYSVSTYAVTLNVENGVLMGATGVSVDGEFYNVSFIDGSCADLFDGCNESSDFFFPLADGLQNATDSSKSVLASRALIDQVFIDSELGLFDSEPFLTNGCNYVVCFAITPMLAPRVGQFSSVTADNTVLDHLDSIGITSGTSSIAVLESDIGDVHVFAVWSNVATVPVTSAIWLLGTGLIGLIGMKKKR